MGSTTSLAELVRLAMESRLLDVFTAAAGKVHTYNSATNRAEIELAIRRPIDNEEGDTGDDSIAILRNVRVAFFQSTGYSITMPLIKGDTGLVIFDALDHAQWMQSGETSDPDNLRLHGPGSATFIPCIAPDAKAIPEAIIDALVIKAPDIHLGRGNPVDYVALAQLVRTELQTLLTAITSATTNPVPDGGAQFKAGILTALANENWPQSVASNKVKSE